MEAIRIMLVAACLVATPAMGAGRAAADLPYRNERLHVSYVIQPDGARVETRETAIRVLHPAAVEYLKKGYLSYSTSVERAEVLEAYNLKADGRRLDVPKSNYQYDINKGSEENSPAFSDRTRVTMIYPEVAVGDLLTLKYRVTETEPMFPGHFSLTERFSKYESFDEVRVRLDFPVALAARYSVTDMRVLTDEVKGERHVLEWTWANPTAAKRVRAGYLAYDPDREPGYAFSTFMTYSDIAQAYWARARTKAVVGDRVRALADEVTRDVSDRREQARLLYEWVATNIHYAGNCVGVGAVVPRDQAFVIDNRMGDCKDQATLLQVMLAAKGIESTQALVNSGQTFKLPRIPVVSMVNHVIVYVPSLNLFLDPTSATTPFGMLPMGDADKPVLLVEGYREGMRTPPIPWQSNRVVVKSDLTLKPNGSIGGTIAVSTNGAFAVGGRDRLRNLTAEQKNEFLEDIYKGRNKTGFGRLEHEDPKPLRDSFSYKLEFELEEFTRGSGAGAFSIGPLYGTEASIGMLSESVEDDDGTTPDDADIGCFGLSVTEEYTYRLPKGMKILALPKNVSVANKTVSYRATYAVKAGVLTAKREFVDKTDRNVCKLSAQRELDKLTKKVIAADLKSQVVYQ